MNRPASAVDAISPAIERMQRMLFRPFDLGQWLILGFLTFLQLLGEGGGYTGSSWNRGAGSDEARRTVEETLSWISAHMAIVAVIGFFLVLVFLALLVLFQWLSARGTFCYLDSVARGRAEVVRPWKEHGRLADSLFFWRLIFTLVVLFAIVLLAIPIVLALSKAFSSGHDFGPLDVLFGGAAGLAILVLVLFVLCALVVKVLLVDFVAPVQYARRIRCSEAFRTVIALAKANAGQFILYLVLRILFAILFCARGPGPRMRHLLHRLLLPHDPGHRRHDRPAVLPVRARLPALLPARVRPRVRRLPGPGARRPALGPGSGWEPGPAPGPVEPASPFTPGEPAARPPDSSAAPGELPRAPAAAGSSVGGRARALNAGKGMAGEVRRAGASGGAGPPDRPVAPNHPSPRLRRPPDVSARSVHWGPP